MMKKTKPMKSISSEVTDDAIVVNPEWVPGNDLAHFHKVALNKGTIMWGIDTLNSRYDDIKLHNQIAAGMSLHDLLFHFTFKWNGCSRNGEIDRHLKNLQEYINRKLIGAYNRKREYFAPTYVQFADVAGSRSNKSINNRRESPHHHGLILIHPYTLENWNTLIRTNTLNKISYVESVHVEKCWDPVGWLEYASKYEKAQTYHHEFVGSEIISGFIPGRRKHSQLRETANIPVSGNTSTTYDNRAVQEI